MQSNLSFGNFRSEIEKLGITIDQYESCLVDIFDKVKDNIDVDWSDIVEKYSLPITKDTLRKSSSPIPFGSVFVHEYLKSKGQDFAQKNIKQTTTINSDKTESSESEFYIEDETKLRDYDYLLRLHNYDPRLFEIISAKNSKWNSGNKTLCSSKITVKAKSPSILEEDISKWFEKLDRKYSKQNIQITDDYLSGDKLLILPISDLHFALRASVFETGNEYNCDIAEKLLFSVIQNVISRTNQYNFKKIIFTIGGDMANADNLIGTTTKGTPQDNDSGWYDMCEKLYAITIQAIDILADIAPVEVIWIPSNHDKTVGFALAKYCEAWFRDDERVSVDYSPLTRKYVVFGKTMFVFAHDEDIKKLPKSIPDEARKYWSDVNYVEVFLQHLHTELILTEEYGMRIQRLPSVCARSKWTVDSNYKSKRQNKSFIYDIEDGLTDVVYTTIK